MTPEERARALVDALEKDGVMDWTDWRDDLADMIAAAIRTINFEDKRKAVAIREARAEALEEAARVAQSVAQQLDALGDDYEASTIRDVMARILALKDKQEGENNPNP